MLSVEIYSNGEQEGTISHDGSKFIIAPPGSTLLQKILAHPVYVVRDGRLVDVTAQDDPAEFLKGLAGHYKSQGVFATQAQDDGAGPPPSDPASS